MTSGVMVIPLETLDVLLRLLDALDKGTVVWQADEHDLLLLTDLHEYGKQVVERRRAQLARVSEEDDDQVPF